MFSLLPSCVSAALRDFQDYSLARLSGPRSGQGKRLIQSLAHTIAEHFGIDPSNPRPAILPALESFRVTCRVLAQRSGRAGELVPQSGGFLLTVFESDPLLWALDSPKTPFTRRGWFTLGHELAHVAFYRMESANSTPRRIVPRPLGAEAERRREEGLCEDFARALLLPESAKGRIVGNGSLDELLALWRGLDWQVPLGAAIRRIVYDWSLWTDNVFVVISDEAKREHFWGRDLTSRSATLRKRIDEGMRTLFGERTLTNIERIERLKTVAISACPTDSGVLMVLGERDIQRLATAPCKKHHRESPTMF